MLPLYQPDRTGRPGRSRWFFIALAGALGTLTVQPTAAQTPAVPAGERIVLDHSLPTIGTVAEDALRIRQILGLAPTHGFLLRSPSSSFDWAGAGFGAALLSPEFSLAWNSAVPMPDHDGYGWAGRGASVRILAGGALKYDRIYLILAPEFVHSANLEFETAPWAEDTNHPYVRPWHVGPHSIDLPLRLGSEPVTRLTPGQSSLGIEAGAAVVGVATENHWWGPGIRNAIVLSNQAPGFPHLFARTARPVNVVFGELEARWILGALRDSDLFPDSIGQSRSLSGLAVTYRPWAEPNLTLGLARTVYTTVDGPASTIPRAADVLLQWPRRVAPDSALHADHEQILALFGRWVFPESGFEAYLEWARHELPVSLRDLLEAPNHSQGYTVGVQHLASVGGWARLRTQGEMTYLEKSPTGQHRPVGSYYSSEIVPRGYTHQGRVIGAAIGPAGSSQWVAADLVEDHWRLGIFGGRIRWDNDAYYDNPLGVRRYHGHDVSILGGVRAGLDIPFVRVGIEYSAQRRYNYLFQSRAGSWEDQDSTVTVDNGSLRLRLTALPGPARRPEPVPVPPFPASREAEEVADVVGTRAPVPHPGPAISFLAPRPGGRRALSGSAPPTGNSRSPHTNAWPAPPDPGLAPASQEPSR